MFGWFKKKKENGTTENNSSVDFITQLKVVEDGSVVIETGYNIEKLTPLKIIDVFLKNPDMGFIKEVMENTSLCVADLDRELTNKDINVSIWYDGLRYTVKFYVDKKDNIRMVVKDTNCKEVGYDYVLWNTC